MNPILINYIKNRIKEPSSWRGLIMLAASLGLISTEHAEQLGPCADIIAAAFASSGIIGVLFPNKL